MVEICVKHGTRISGFVRCELCVLEDRCESFAAQIRESGEKIKVLSAERSNLFRWIEESGVDPEWVASGKPFGPFSQNESCPSSWHLGKEWRQDGQAVCPDCKSGWINYD